MDSNSIAPAQQILGSGITTRYRPTKMEFVETAGVQDVVSLLHGNGSDQSTTFTDEAGLLTWLATGNTQLDTAQKKFGSASILFEDVDDALDAGPVDNLIPSGYDWSIDFWFRSAEAYYQGLTVSLKDAADGVLANLNLNADVQSANMYDPAGNSIDGIYDGAENLAANTWYHIALERFGDLVTLYIDGVIVGTPLTTIASKLEIQRVEISRLGYYSGDLWIDEFRLATAAPYGGVGFTPEVAEYPAPDLTPTPWLGLEVTIPGHDIVITDLVEVITGDSDIDTLLNGVNPTSVSGSLLSFLAPDLSGFTFEAGDTVDLTDANYVLKESDTSGNYHSEIVNRPKYIQVVLNAAATAVVYSKLHEAADWAIAASLALADGDSQIVSFVDSPVNYVKVVDDTASGVVEAWAQW